MSQRAATASSSILIFIDCVTRFPPLRKILAVDHRGVKVPPVLALPLHRLTAGAQISRPTPPSRFARKRCDDTTLRLPKAITLFEQPPQRATSSSFVLRGEGEVVAAPAGYVRARVEQITQPIATWAAKVRPEAPEYGTFEMRQAYLAPRTAGPK